MNKKLIIIISSVVAELIIGGIAMFFIIDGIYKNDIKNRKKFELVYEDFTYAKDEDGHNYVDITGLSDEGKKKDVIVVPFQIEGYIVRGFTTYYSYEDYVDFTTAKTIYLGAAEYLSDRLKIGKNSTIYGGNLDLYKKVLKTNSDQYVSENDYNSITKKYKNHDKIHKTSVVFDFEYEDHNYLYVSSDTDGKINYVPEFDLQNTNYRLKGWYNGDTQWDFSTDLVTDYTVLTAEWR